jgi:hypothetical protein
MTRDLYGASSQTPIGAVTTVLPPTDKSKAAQSIGKEAAKEFRGSSDASSDRRDLCCICDYAAECMHRGTDEHPKSYCELFDVDVSALVPRTDAGRSCHGNDDVSTVGGLCCNCENRKRCTIRLVEGDVWHCEEYC